MTKIIVFLSYGENRAYTDANIGWRTTDDGALKIITKDLVGNTVVRAWFQPTEWRWFEVLQEGE